MDAIENPPKKIISPVDAFLICFGPDREEGKTEEDKIDE